MDMNILLPNDCFWLLKIKADRDTPIRFETWLLYRLQGWTVEA